MYKMDNEQFGFMYGKLDNDYGAEKDCDTAKGYPTPSVSRVREILIEWTTPFFQGDNIDGQILACQKLEKYILGQ